MVLRIINEAMRELSARRQAAKALKIIAKLIGETPGRHYVELLRNDAFNFLFRNEHELALHALRLALTPQIIDEHGDIRQLPVGPALKARLYKYFDECLRQGHVRRDVVNCDRKSKYGSELRDLARKVVEGAF